MPSASTVRPGAYALKDPKTDDSYTVVWWDPLLLDTPADDNRGLRRDDLITKDARPEDVAADRARYDAWCARKAEILTSAAKPSLQIVTTTAWAAAAKDDVLAAAVAAVAIEDAGVTGPRPSGKRFGVFVHALLAIVPLDAADDHVHDLAAVQARMLGVPDVERDEASMIVERVLRHPVLRDARQAEKTGRPCRREAPVSIVIDDALVDGQVDLAFEGDQGWTVVDFKTDVELAGAEDLYRRQVALYTHAIAKITGRPARGLVLRV